MPVTTSASDNSPDNNAAAEDAKLLRQQTGTARTLLFIVAAITLISAILLTPYLPSAPTIVNMSVTLVVAVLYLCLALWATKRPYSAIRVGLLVLGIVILADILIGPYGAFNRWQSKLLTLCFLLLGLADSRDAQRKMDSRKVG